MTFWEFAWQALPDALRSLLPADYTGDEGRTPDDELARVSWPAIRDRWLLLDEQRTREFASLLDELGVARTTRSQTDSDADFVRTVRNTSGLRHAIVRYLIGVAEATSVDPGFRVGAPPSESSADANSGIPSSDFAPRNFMDFTRLASLNEFSWGYWLLNASNAVETLLPGESIFLGMAMDGPPGDGNGAAAVGFLFRRISGSSLQVIGAPDFVLPKGVAYAPLREQLVDLGWFCTPEGVPLAEFPWPEGIDDGLVLAQQTFRSAFLIDGPGRSFESGEIRPPEGMLPAAPLPAEVICPTNAEELISVVGSVIRAMGGYIIADADATTHGFRAGEWSGWIHADPRDLVLDVVVIALDHEPGATMFDASHVIELQTRAFRYCRVVVSGTQTLVAASFPCQAFTGASIQALLLGVIADATACVGSSRSVSDADQSFGGYL